MGAEASVAAEPQPRSTHPDEALGAASLGGFSSSCRVGPTLQVVMGRGETRNTARLHTLTFHNPTDGAMEQEGRGRGHRKRQRCGHGAGWGRLGRAWELRDVQLRGTGRRGPGWPGMVTRGALGVLLLLHLASGEQPAPYALRPSLGDPGSGTGRACLEQVLRGAQLTGRSTSSVVGVSPALPINFGQHWSQVPFASPQRPGDGRASGVRPHFVPQAAAPRQAWLWDTGGPRTNSSAGL